MYAAANLAALLWGAFTIPDNRGLSLSKVEENYESQKKNDIESVNNAQNKLLDEKA
jgi:hypothetical protein